MDNYTSTTKDTGSVMTESSLNEAIEAMNKATPSFLGIKIVENPFLEPNEMVLMVGKDVMARMKLNDNKEG